MRYKVFTLLLFCVVASFAQNQVVRRQGTKKPTSSSTTKKQSTSTTKKQGSSKTNKKTSATTPKKTTKVGGSTTKKTNSSATKKVSTTDSESGSSNSPSNQTTSQQIHQVNASYSYGVLIVNGVRYEMVKVNAGTFTMGATTEMQNPYDYEKPAHQVTLTNNYYLGKTEVTQALWTAVMGSNPSNFKGDNKPVERVSWNDCQSFISKLNAATGKNFRLPTEAEWEFAARGGNNSRHYQYSGSNTLNDVGWYTDNNSNTTHDVATKRPNELGLFDMSGNVWEWCSDWYGSYSSNTQYDPAGPTSGSDRVSRGGGWKGSAWACRSSGRFYGSPGSRYDILGLRLALSE